MWATTLSGQAGFVKPTDNHHLSINLKQIYGDPAKLCEGAGMGSVGLMQHNRRRNMLNGIVESIEPERLVLRVTQSFGNCPKYIQGKESFQVSLPNLTACYTFQEHLSVSYCFGLERPANLTR